jgi:hypothetical protein
MVKVIGPFVVSSDLSIKTLLVKRLGLIGGYRGQCADRGYDKK